MKFLFKLADFTRFIFTGKTLNDLRDRCIEQVPLAGNGILTTDEARGIRIHASRTGSTGVAALDFGASLSGSSCTVRSGKVLHTDWGTFDENDPANDGWTELAVTVSGSTLTLADGDSVWLHLTLASTTVDVVGPLSSTDAEAVSVTGGAGGGGGQGGGGGGGAGQALSDATDGTDGEDGGGVTPGIGGFGGTGTNYGNGSSTTPAGDGSPGGSGGIGEDGEDGRAVDIYEYVNAKLKLKRWRVTAGSLTTATNQPSSTETAAYLRICERDGDNLIQHQVGCVTLTLPTVTYVAST